MTTQRVDLTSGSLDLTSFFYEHVDPLDLMGFASVGYSKTIKRSPKLTMSVLTCQLWCADGGAPEAKSTIGGATPAGGYESPLYNSCALRIFEYFLRISSNIFFLHFVFVY